MNINLHEHYIKDLQTFVSGPNNIRRPRTRHIKTWESLPPIVKQGQNLDLQQYWNIGRPIWCWSDQHFFHRNIIAYSNRPFKDLTHMREQMVINYNNTVDPSDVVIFGGDFAFGAIPERFELLNRLNGYKILIVGNHDINKKKAVDVLSFDEVHVCLSFDVPATDKTIWFTHYPLLNIPYENIINVHGHIHTHAAPSPQHFNISVEQINYTPINLSRILESV